MLLFKTYKTEFPFSKSIPFVPLFNECLSKTFARLKFAAGINIKKHLETIFYFLLLQPYNICS